MAKDINGIPLKVGDEVTCEVSSIIMAPCCTHPFERPSRIAPKKREELSLHPNDDIDTVIIKRFNNAVRNAKMHRDVIIGRRSLSDNVKLKTFVISEISGEHIMFKNPSDVKHSFMKLKHYHPSVKFKKR
jgi:hypothetical protein